MTVMTVNMVKNLFVFISVIFYLFCLIDNAKVVRFLKPCKMFFPIRDGYFSYFEGGIFFGGGQKRASFFVGALVFCYLCGLIAV